MSSKLSKRSDHQRPKLLMIAYCFDKNGTMEERNGWNRAVLATRLFDVTILCSPKRELKELEADLPESIPLNRFQIVPIRLTSFYRNMERREATFYRGYREWQMRAYFDALERIRTSAFHAIHVVTLCGYREPGPFWKLGLPLVWGPIGGTHDFSFRYSRLLDTTNYIRESIRAAINRYQLRHSKRLKDAMSHSTEVIAATEAARRDFMASGFADMPVDLETGVDYPIAAPKRYDSTSRPIRLLWCGRLRAWKSLPLVLHALAKLPKERAYQLRVLGDGQSGASWKRLAKSLNIDANIEWLDWPGFRESLPHYRWADAFVFTSLRDTSGTGLLDALAAATPIIGVDHQGAADVMTNDCAIKIPLENWNSTVSEFASAINSIATDPDRWYALSCGAADRAQKYHWSRRGDFMEKIYKDVFQRAYGYPLLCDEPPVQHLVGQR